MAQNTSTAVMARRVEPHDSLDYFPTPPWATRALCEWLISQDVSVDQMTAHDPAAGEGHMVRPLSEYFSNASGADVYDYGAGFPVDDYLMPRPGLWKPDWTIINPPFRLAGQFITTAFQRSQFGVAALVRTAFLEGKERHATIFEPNPPTHVLQFVERVTLVKGRLESRGGTATAYCWLVWMLDRHHGPKLGWLPPCRKRLERSEDYDV